MTNKTKYNFQSEINQLLTLIIHSFYSNKDIFLRELISNANDALDKLRFMSLSDSSILKDNNELCIKITPNKDEKTLTISDNGIGMTKQELIDNLGTIANSGTKKFMETINKKDRLNLIGQFGVGFYSAFLVSKYVKVITKTHKGFQFIWESDAKGSFYIKREKKTMERGTDIVLYLNDDDMKYLDEGLLRDLIKKHSQFINYPIYIYSTDESAYDTDDSDDELDNKDYQLINIEKPLWHKNPDDVIEQDYIKLFNHLIQYDKQTNQNLGYIDKKYFRIEGNVSFNAVLFVPKKAPADIFEAKGKVRNIRLYVKRVFVMDDYDDLLPEYLNFVRCVVDSADLPLNISREYLQQNPITKTIKKFLTKKSIEMFYDITKDKDKYVIFYKEYSKNLKLGIYEETELIVEKLAGLLRYYTSTHENEWRTLDDYIKSMQTEQKYIYYLSGESVDAIRNSPFLEKCKDKNYEVIYMPEPIDEYVTNKLFKYKGIQLVCLSRDHNMFNITQEEQRFLYNSIQEYDQVCKTIKNILGDRITNVKISDKLISSPCCLTTINTGWNANMERIMRTQVLNCDEMNEVMASKKVLEINPRNNIIKLLKNKIEIDDFEIVNNIIELLYDTSLLECGFIVENPRNLTLKIHKLMEFGLCE
jgi:molecular chaperone HtpG